MKIGIYLLHLSHVQTYNQQKTVKNSQRLYVKYLIIITEIIHIFFFWFAGIVDGDGNFDLRNIDNKLVLKAIRIKLHDRDVRILTYIQNTLHIGRIRADKNKPHSIWIVSTKEEMLFLINKLNGLIRLKVDGFFLILRIAKGRICRS